MLTGIGRPITHVSGDRTAVDEFAGEWLRANPGTSTAVAMSQRLYRLGELIDPGTPGEPRVASTADREMLIAWRRGFVAENPGLPSSDLDRAVDRMLTYGGLMLWTVEGSPVSVASLTRPVGGMVRVGSVYTPPELRRRGYAAAIVAHVSRVAREAGSPEVVLFTDIANPTSNSVYQRIGFRAVEDRVVLDLLPPR
jgi:GNAT superfamily N-acetyltransferase